MQLRYKHKKTQNPHQCDNDSPLHTYLRRNPRVERNYMIKWDRKAAQHRSLLQAKPRVHSSEYNRINSARAPTPVSRVISLRLTSK